MTPPVSVWFSSVRQVYNVTIFIIIVLVAEWFDQQSEIWFFLKAGSFLKSHLQVNTNRARYV
ncbi:UNVERIFIED_CONTAM: hypothetical protein FKN15_047523 [Acipenser sinensis]